MKRLIFTVTNDLSFDQRMIRICTSLSREGYKVLLVGRQRSGSLPLQNQPFGQRRLKLLFGKGKLFYLEYNLRLFFFLLSEKFDAVCAIDLDTLLPALFAGRLKQKKVAFDAHEYFTEVPEVVGRPLVKRVWTWMAKFGIPKVDLAYTVGGQLASILYREYGKQFEVIRNLPFRQIWQPQDTASGRPRILLYQGVLNEGRGLEELIEAMTRLEGVELWLAGEGDRSRELRALVVKFGLSDKVKFLGYRLPDELRQITRQAYLGLNLLKDCGLSYYYSLANKAFDYIQAGVPSLQMDFPEYRNLNETYGTFMLLHDLSPDSVAASIRTLLTEEQMYRQLQNNCRRAATELIWENEVKELLALYYGLLI
jgi:glycosyltransferase involved in cell wall biosynthesis